MKLVATRWICDQTPAGASFEVPDADAQLLIDMGLAKPDDSDPPTPADRHGRRYRRRDLSPEGAA